MHTKEKKSSLIAKVIIATIIAIYVLFPFALVVINSCKRTQDITANPIGLNGVSFQQLLSNMNDVVNNTHFMFWQAVGYSALIEQSNSSKPLSLEVVRPVSWLP